jgi:hypothetical protein
VLLRHLRQTHTSEAVTHNSGPVNVKRRTAYPASLQFRSPHPSLHSFDDKAALQFSNGSNNYDHSSSEWASGIYIFSKTDKFDTQVIQFIEDFQKVAYTAGNSIKGGNERNVEAVPAGIFPEAAPSRDVSILRPKLCPYTRAQFHIGAV